MTDSTNFAEIQARAGTHSDTAAPRSPASSFSTTATGMSCNNWGIARVRAAKGRGAKPTKPDE